MQQLLLALYQGFLSFEKRGTAFDPHTPGGCCVNLGLGYFLLIAITLYLANLVKYMVLESGQVTAVQGLDDILNNPEHLICAFDGHKTHLMSKGVPEMQIVTLLSRSDVLSNLEAGTCIAATA